jgi:hypothetical protein
MSEKDKDQDLQAKLLLEFAAWKRKIRKRYASFAPLRKRGEAVKPKIDEKKDDR